MHSETSNDIPRVVLFVLVIAALLVGSLWTLLPFLNALIWAMTIAIATWPMLLRVQQFSGGRRWLAVAIMTVLVLLVFIVPLALAISALIDAARESQDVINDFIAHGLGPPPVWIAKIPVVGSEVAAKWQTLSDGGPTALAQFVQPYAGAAASWALAATGGLAKPIVLVLLILILVVLLYAQGETAASGVLAFAHRLGGDTGQRTVILAGQAVRSVALGVVATALIQAVLAGIGLWLCGIPHPGLLTAVAFMLGVAQVGPALVLVPSIGWLYWSGNTGWGTALLIWSLPVAALDNVVRPLFIRRGVQLPLLLIVAGVIGGLISFGLVGLFVGPVILAATYTLTKDWIARGQSPKRT